MLSAKNLSYSYDDQPLFSNLGLTIGPGGVLVVKGPNGSGKTTLLKLLSGILTPTTGDISYCKYDIYNHRDEYGHLIQFLGHQLAVKPHITVRDNIHFWAKLRGTPELTDAAIQFFELTPYAYIPCTALSQGWQKKVALARLLACHSELWLLDEPFTNLDTESKEKLEGLIEVRSSQNGIVIVATHEKINLPNVMELDIREFAS